MATVSVTRTYLEMTSPEQLIGAAGPTPPDILLAEVAGCPPAFYRYLYAEVGREYHWRDRLGWTDERIQQHLGGPVRLWLMLHAMAPAGYFELAQHDDDSVELAYFGLLPHAVGRGLGRYLLIRSVEEAWRLGPRRVWLHTCTLDHPAALQNYLKRGFQPFKTEVYETELA